MNFIPFFRPPIKWEYVGPLFFLSFMACQSEQTTFTRIEDSPVIDRLLDSAPHFVVNTETPTERWVAVTQLGIPKDSLILGRPGHMIAVGDSIYISEDSGHNIFAVGNDGYLNRKIGRQGKAPGEFNFIMDIGYNGSYIFVREPNGVQIFTENFEYANSFLTNMNTGLQFRSSVSADYMFLECIGIDWLVCPYSTSPPHARIESGKLLPALDLDNQSGENANLIPPYSSQIAI